MSSKPSGGADLAKDGDSTVETELVRSSHAVRRAMARTSKSLTAGQRKRIHDGDPLEILIQRMHAEDTESAERVDIAKFLLNKILPTPKADSPGEVSDKEASAWMRRLPSTK